MKKPNKKYFLKGFTALSVFVLSSCGIKYLPSKDVGEDNLTYEDELVVPFEAGKFVAKDEETTPEVKKIILHYANDDGKCNTRRFYIWTENVDGDRLGDIKPDIVDPNSMMVTIDFSDPKYAPYGGTSSLKFIIKYAGMWAGQSTDTVLNYKDFTIDNDGTVEVWCLTAEGGVVEVYDNESETKFDKVKTAKFISWNKILASATAVPSVYRLYAFDQDYLKSNDQIQQRDKGFHLLKSGVPTSSDFTITLNYSAHINIKYVLETEYDTNPGRVQKCTVSYEYLYTHPSLKDRFEKYYTYDGELGAMYTKESTTFRLWAPTTAHCRLNLYPIGTPSGYKKGVIGTNSGRQYNMVYRPGGVWEVTVQGDIKELGYSYYSYTINNTNGENEICDPYAHGAGIDGIRGFIYSAEEVNPEGWDDLSYDKLENGSQDLSIYEVHIRDLTMDETWISNEDNARGTYKAFAESGTTYSKDGKTVTTGFDHIKELGVNAIQLMPVFDQDNSEDKDKIKYNWGYNPLNYNAVEGGYSSDPYHGEVRIKEFKELIQKYGTKTQGKDDQIRVIMDVVYNHVSSANNSNFNKIMPKYYFRYDSQWNLYDGSGCNNEVKSEATMMRKFIVDSLKWWATEFKIKGFRFDLMGLIDTETLKVAKQELYKIDPDIFIYGEGWTSGGFHGTDNTKGAFTENIYKDLYSSDESKGVVGAFNDLGRNSVKGSNGDGYNNNPYPQFGYISKTSDVGTLSSNVTDMMKGKYSDSVGANPRQTVNYVSCHDNFTLWDQLQYTLANGYKEVDVPNQTQKGKMPVGEAETSTLITASIASHASIMMSNGAGFMLGGEELYRTKAHTQQEIEEQSGTTIRAFPNYCHYSTDPEVTKATDDVVMFDRVITHNSYKSSDAVNSFKWDRKIKIGEQSTYEYNKVWQDMLATRKELTKRAYPDNSDDTYGDFNCWYNNDGTIDGCHLFGFRNGDYYFFFSGRYDGTQSIDFGLANNVETIFSSRVNYVSSGSSVTLPAYTFVCLKATGSSK